MSDLPVVGVQLVAANLAGFENTLIQANKAASNFASNVSNSIAGIRSPRFDFQSLEKGTSAELNKVADSLIRTFGAKIGKMTPAVPFFEFGSRIKSQSDFSDAMGGQKMAADAARYTQDVAKSFDVMSAAVANDMIAMASAIKSPALYSNSIARQIDAYSKKFLPNAAGSTDWIKQIQSEMQKVSPKADSTVAESATKTASVVTASADKIAIAKARIEMAETKAATAAAVGANQIAASQSKAQLSAANTAAGITIANNRVVSSYAQTAANVIGSISNIVQSVNRMLLSIANTVGTMLNNVISAVGRVGGILGGALGAAGGVMGGAAGGIGGALQSAIKFVTSFGQSSSTASGGVDKLASSIKNVGTAAEGTRNPLTFMQNTLSSAIGFGIAKAAEFAVGKVQWMFDQFFKSTMDYQNAQVGLVGLLQRELIKGGMDIADALVPATQQSKWLTKELSDLAILSPYMMKDVQQMFKESMAFGQSAMGAKQFTKDILNIAAGLGASNDMLQRMAYNFSQIGMEGSISALNLRQLAQAGFDLTAVIIEVGKATGVSMKTHNDFNDAITSGTIAWEDFDKALTTVSETQFKGAAERMARTLLGLQNNIKDFFNLTVPLLTLPAADAVAARANIIFNKFVEFRGSGTLEALGQMFGDWVGNALDSLGELAEQTGSFFGGIAGAAYEWGGNLIVQFAGGIIDAVGWALDNAFSLVSNVISYWLSPGSPPNVAPGLRIWGAAALSEWLGGFKDADWDVFDGITKTLKSVFDLLGSDMYNTIGINLAQFLSDIALTGKSDIDIIAQITAATGDFGAEMAKLVKIQLDYAAALKGVEDADKRIAAGESKQAALVREYNKMRKAGATPAALRAKGLEIEATKDEIYLAEKQKIEDEAKLKLMKGQLALQEKLVNALIDFAKQQEKMNKDAERERNAAEKAAKDTSPNTLPRVVKPSVWPDMTGPDMDKIKKDILANWNAIFKPLAPLQKKLDALIGRLTNFGNLLFGYDTVDAFAVPIRVAGVLTKLLDRLNISVLPGISAGFDKVIDGFIQLLSGDAESAWKTWGDVAADVCKNIGDALGETWTNFSGWWENGADGSLPGKTQIGSTAKAITDKIGGALSAGWAAFSGWWSTVPPGEGGKSGQQIIGDIAGGILGGIGGALSTAWSNFSSWWTTVPPGEGGKSGEQIIGGIAKGILDGIGGALSKAWTNFSGWWENGANGSKPGKDIIGGIFTEIGTKASEVGAKLSSAWTDFGNWWAKGANGSKPGKEILGTMWTEVTDKLGTALTDAFGKLQTWYVANKEELWTGIWKAAIFIAEKVFVPLLIGVFALAWDGFVIGVKTITIRLALGENWKFADLFSKDPDARIPLDELAKTAPPIPFNWTFEYPKWYMDLMNLFGPTGTMQKLYSTPPAIQRPPIEEYIMAPPDKSAEYFNKIQTDSEETSAKVIADNAAMWAGVGATHYAMMPMQQSAWQTFTDSISSIWTTFTAGINTTWETMWTNIDSAFIIKRDLLFAGWNTFWGTITVAWGTWTSSITTSWDTFWNNLRDNLAKWKEENVDKLWESGSSIIGAIINGMTAAVQGMTDIGSRIVNAVFGQAILAVRQWLFDKLGIGTDPSANMAAGGIATKATVRTIGESGREAVIPLQSARSIQLLARAFNQAAIMQSSMGRIVMPLSGMSMGAGNGTTYNQNLYVSTIQPAVNVLQSYESMRAYYGTY